MRLWAIVAAGFAVIGGALSVASPASAQQTMRAFSNDAELKAFFNRVQRSKGNRVPPPMAPPPPAAPPPMAMAVPSAAADSSSQRSAAVPSITNVQTQGVDEGGIVKTHGTHLVVLRRGRLFTIDTSGGDLKPVDQVDAFPPSDSGAGRGAWYDEMLITNDLVVVIGFNYARSGTEINRFRISDSGKLTYLDTHHLRSNDYYSSRNYASRLIGSKLVVYTPHFLGYRSDVNIKQFMPALRRWSEKGPDAGFEVLATPRRTYIAEMLRRARKVNIDVIHAVTSCDLAAERLKCSATSVLGSASRNFYVAEDAVYVWTGDLFSTRWENDGDLRGMVYRIPLDGKAPQAVGVVGNPTDQFSFLARDGVLNVLVRADGGGEAMWQAEVKYGDLALLRLPLSRFGNGSRMAPKSLYQGLPGGNEISQLQNRYVGGHLLYGGASAYRWDSRGQRTAVGDQKVRVVGLKDRALTELDGDMSVTRIDQMGRDAMVIGQSRDGALLFQPVALDGTPRMLDAYGLPATREGENRSHAYFFRPDDNSPTGDSGTLGLPVARALMHPNARFLGSGSGIFFLRRDNRALSPAGHLDANAERAVADNCLASCVDWYGNARPIFYGDRIFALLGYELVEGRIEAGAIKEQRRVDFTPVAKEARQ